MRSGTPVPPPRHARGQWAALAVAVAVLLAGLVGSLAPAGVTAQRQQAAVAQGMDRRAQIVQAAVSAEALRYVDAVQGVAAGITLPGSGAGVPAEQAPLGQHPAGHGSAQVAG